MTAPAKIPLRERRRREVIRLVERIALDQFVENGFDNVSVATICDLAGISPSTFFRHFPSKDAIISGVIRTTVDETAERLRDLPLAVGLAEGYLTAFGEQVRETEWAADDTFYTYTRVMISRAFRAAFIEDLSRTDASTMDSEIARRLGVPIDDPTVRMIRVIQWAAVDLAIRTLTPGDGIAAFLAAIRVNLEVLAPIDIQASSLT